MTETTLFIVVIVVRRGLRTSYLCILNALYKIVGSLYMLGGNAGGRCHFNDTILFLFCVMIGRIYCLIKKTIYVVYVLSSSKLKIIK